MSQPLILQELLSNTTLPWRVHNCKLSQNYSEPNAPLPFLMHYDALDEATKAARPLSFAQLKWMDEPMSIAQAAALSGVDEALFADTWHIKYVGTLVIFCEPLALALRVNFTNTSKPAQVVHVLTYAEAWTIEARHYRFFGVVDVLYKGDTPLNSVAEDELPIPKSDQYVMLPSAHSLTITNGLNDYSEEFDFIQDAVIDKLRSAGGV